jgi:CubicO group peptidase (beta-lactamase class C family)
MEVSSLAGRLTEEIPGELARREIPGLAIGICSAGEVLWSAGFGTTQRRDGSDVTTSTIFSVQSTSKMYTATAVLLAVQQSGLDLDEPVTTYLPEFEVSSAFEPRPAERMTLRHLLSHTAGFTHEAPAGSNYRIGRGSFEAHCQSIAGTWLRFPVGHHFEYSNLGIDLAGYIVQRVTGVPFARYVRRELLEPLGLQRSTFDPRAIAADRNRARGHWKVFAAARRPLPLKIPMVAAGGLYASVQDALRYVQFHLRGGEQLLDPALLGEQYRIPFPAPGQSRGYGLGVYLDQWDPGVGVRQHGGAGFGFLCQLCWIPELGLGAVVLTNSFGHTLHNELAARIVRELATSAGRVAGRPPAGPGDDGAAAPAPAGDGELAGPADASAAGEYIGRLGDCAEVVAGPGRLRVRGAGPGRYRVLPPAGGSAGYLQNLADGTTRYKNDPGATPASALDPDRAGTYVLKASGVTLETYRILQDGDSPVIEMPDDNEEPGGRRLRLRLAPLAPGRYLSSMGEVLDLRPDRPVYANMQLTRVRDEGR